MQKRIGIVLAILATLTATILLRAQVQKDTSEQKASVAEAPKAGNTPAAATVISGASLQDAFNAPVGDNRVDQPVRVVNVGTAEFGVYTLTEVPRKAATSTGPITGQFHSVVGEIYQVVSGAGTFLVGTQLDPSTVTNRVSVLTGPGGNGVIKDPQFIKFQAGTILIIPPGVPHNATYEITEKTSFIVYRYDPGKTLPLK